MAEETTTLDNLKDAMEGTGAPAGDTTEAAPAAPAEPKCCQMPKKRFGRFCFFPELILSKDF